MKKYIVIVIILALVIGFYIFRNKPEVKLTDNKIVTEETRLQLPEGWTLSENGMVDVQFEKKVESGIVPKIVFKKSTSQEAQNPAKYVDKLIAGAKSTVTSYKVVTDERTTADLGYLAIIKANYVNNKQKIEVSQRIYIIGEEVYTITGSYTGELGEEVDQIIEAVAKDKVGK